MSFALPDRRELESRIAAALDGARAAGASAADASVSVSRGLSVTVRAGDVEALEFQHDRDLSLTAWFGQRRGAASTADLTDSGIAAAVEAACTLAKASGEDPCTGLADPARMAREFPDLSLDHPWDLSPEDAIEMARAAEAAALAEDARVTRTEGAMVQTARGIELYGNTHGFLGERTGTDHSLWCSALAGSGSAMQREDWYDAARDAARLSDPAEVGRTAARRAVARLGAKPLSTRRAPVLFTAEVARSLWAHLVEAISGGALYRQASFLLDRAGTVVFSPNVTLTQQPFLPGAAGSNAFDHEGVATAERTIVDAGTLTGYLLGSYSARKLGLETTGNAGGVWNLVAQPGPLDFDGLLAELGTGLVVTELMGQGFNAVTGDYSRGASGYWVEGGEAVHPVREVTIAGNLGEAFRAVRAVGADVDTRGQIRTGSVLVDGLTIAGR